MPKIDLKTAQATVSYEDAELITQYIITGKSSTIIEPVEVKVAKPKKEVEVKEESEVKVPKINEQDKVTHIMQVHTGDMDFMKMDY